VSLSLGTMSNIYGRMLLMQIKKLIRSE
jgi:hypothetical protein